MATPGITRKNSARYLDRLAESYDSRKYCDVKITCQGKVFEASKSLLSMQSEVFEKMFFGGFKEAKDGVADLSDEDPETVEKLLEFCHRFAYQLDPHAEEDGRPIVPHMRLYVAGDNFMIPELREMALKNFRRACLSNWQRAEFVKAIQEAYQQSDHDILRSIVRAVTQAGLRSYRKNLDTSGFFWDVVLQQPQFAKDVLFTVSQGPEEGHGTFICPTDGEEIDFYFFYVEKGRVPWPCTNQIVDPRCSKFLWVNSRGKMLGGLAQGFQKDEMPL